MKKQLEIQKKLVQSCPLVWKLGPQLSDHPPTFNSSFPLNPSLVELWTQHCEHPSIPQTLIASFNFFNPSFCWSGLCSCTPSWLDWCQSLVLEVIFEGLRQREALNLLKPLPTHRQAGRTPTQVHQRKRLSWREGQRDCNTLEDSRRLWGKLLESVNLWFCLWRVMNRFSSVLIFAPLSFIHA